MQNKAKQSKNPNIQGRLTCSDEFGICWFLSFYGRQIFMLASHSSLRELFNLWSNNALNDDATYALRDYLFLCGPRENLWNLHNCTARAGVCRYNSSEDGAVDRPTLLPLSCIQNKNVSVAWHVPGLHKYNAWVKILGKEWLRSFPDNWLHKPHVDVSFSVS